MTATAVMADRPLIEDLLAHLDVQLASARRMRQIVLEQASAIRRRAVRQVVATTGELQVEMHRRELIERDRMRLMERAGHLLGLAPAAVGFSGVAALMDPASASIAQGRTDELRGLLAEIEREHELNRLLMAQELSFLDHLLGLAGGSGSYAARAQGTARGGAEFGRIRTNANLRRRVFDVEA
jgi:hypothetical protein